MYVGTDIGSSSRPTAAPRAAASAPGCRSWRPGSWTSTPPRLLLDGTHGRGAYPLSNSTAAPALIVTKTDDGTRSVRAATSIHGDGAQRGQRPTRRTSRSPTRSRRTPPSSRSPGERPPRARDVTWTGVHIPARQRLDALHGADRQCGSQLGADQIMDDGVVVTATPGSGRPAARTPLRSRRRTRCRSSPPPPAVAPKWVSRRATSRRSPTRATWPTRTTWPPLGRRPGEHVPTPPCTTPLATTPTVEPGASTDVCGRLAVPASAAEGADERHHADGDLVGGCERDGERHPAHLCRDGGHPAGGRRRPTTAGDTAPYYKDALTTAGSSYAYWDLRPTRTCPMATSPRTRTWSGRPATATRRRWRGYKRELTALLDGGGRLLMSGQDILDQAAGTTPFVQNYLHVEWDGSEVQNDKPTATVTGVAGNPVTNGIGAIPIDHSVLGATFEDRVTPIAPATPAYTDDSGRDRRAHRGRRPVQGRVPRLPVGGVRRGRRQGRPGHPVAVLVQRALIVPRSRVSPAARPGSAARTARCPRGRRAPPSRRRPGRCPPGSRRGR